MAFGKVKYKNGGKCDKELVELQRKKLVIGEGKSDPDVKEKLVAVNEEIAAGLVAKERESLQKGVGNLLDLKKNKGTSAALFNLRQKVVGPKSATTDAVSIIDPGSGREIKSAHGIRKATLDYCHKLLSNREPSKDYCEDLDMKRSIHVARMQDISDHELEPLSKADFNATLKRYPGVVKHQKLHPFHISPKLVPQRPRPFRYTGD